MRTTILLSSLAATAHAAQAPTGFEGNIYWPNKDGDAAGNAVVGVSCPFAATDTDAKKLKKTLPVKAGTLLGAGEDGATGIKDGENDCYYETEQGDTGDDAAAKEQIKNAVTKGCLVAAIKFFGCTVDPAKPVIAADLAADTKTKDAAVVGIEHAEEAHDMDDAACAANTNGFYPFAKEKKTCEGCAGAATATTATAFSHLCAGATPVCKLNADGKAGHTCAEATDASNDDAKCGKDGWSTNGVKGADVKTCACKEGYTAAATITAATTKDDNCAVTTTKAAGAKKAGTVTVTVKGAVKLKFDTIEECADKMATLIKSAELTKGDNKQKLTDATVTVVCVKGTRRELAASDTDVDFTYTATIVITTDDIATMETWVKTIDNAGMKAILEAATAVTGLTVGDVASLEAAGAETPASSSTGAPAGTATKAGSSSSGSSTTTGLVALFLAAGAATFF